MKKLCLDKQRKLEGVYNSMSLTVYVTTIITAKQDYNEQEQVVSVERHCKSAIMRERVPKSRNR